MGRIFEDPRVTNENRGSQILRFCVSSASRELEEGRKGKGSVKVTSQVRSRVTGQTRKEHNNNETPTIQRRDAISSVSTTRCDALDSLTVEADLAAMEGWRDGVMGER